MFVSPLLIYIVTSAFFSICFLVIGGWLLRIAILSMDEERSSNGEVIARNEGPAESFLSHGVLGVFLVVLGLAGLVVSVFLIFK